jgi:hypothetical protein
VQLVRDCDQLILGLHHTQTQASIQSPNINIVTTTPPKVTISNSNSTESPIQNKYNQLHRVQGTLNKCVMLTGMGILQAKSLDV